MFVFKAPWAKRCEAGRRLEERGSQRRKKPTPTIPTSLLVLLPTHRRSICRSEKFTNSLQGGDRSISELLGNIPIGESRISQERVLSSIVLTHLLLPYSNLLLSPVPSSFCATTTQGGERVASVGGTREPRLIRATPPDPALGCVLRQGLGRK